MNETIPKICAEFILDEYEKPAYTKHEHLFSWDEIPGKDDTKLTKFLKKRFGIDWVEKAKIEKIDHGKTIRLFFENNCLSLKLNDEKTKATLRRNDGLELTKFIARTEKGKLNMYKYKYKHYGILISIKNAPEDTHAVTYELHETYVDPVREVFKCPNFEFEITSYGNYTIKAKIRRKSYTNFISRLLSEALRESYENRSNLDIQNAIKDIEKY